MKTTLKVQGMSCEHCVNHVTEALQEVEGVTAVSVDLASGTAVVEHAENVGVDQLKNAVAEYGYEAV